MPGTIKQEAPDGTDGLYVINYRSLFVFLGFYFFGKISEHWKIPRRIGRDKQDQEFWAEAAFKNFIVRDASASFKF